jgi:hypothetical protein
MARRPALDVDPVSGEAAWAAAARGTREGEGPEGDGREAAARRGQPPREQLPPPPQQQQQVQQQRRRRQLEQVVYSDSDSSGDEGASASRRSSEARDGVVSSESARRALIDDARRRALLMGASHGRQSAAEQDAGTDAAARAARAARALGSTLSAVSLPEPCAATASAAAPSRRAAACAQLRESVVSVVSREYGNVSGYCFDDVRGRGGASVVTQALFASICLEGRAAAAAELLRLCSIDDRRALVTWSDGLGQALLHRLALCEASLEADCAAVARELLLHGAPANARDALGWTPLHYAASHARPLLAQALVEGGADPDLPDAPPPLPAAGGRGMLQPGALRGAARKPHEPREPLGLRQQRAASAAAAAAAASALAQQAAALTADFALPRSPLQWLQLRGDTTTAAAIRAAMLVEVTEPSRASRGLQPLAGSATVQLCWDAHARGPFALRLLLAACPRTRLNELCADRAARDELCWHAVPLAASVAAQSLAWRPAQHSGLIAAAADAAARAHGAPGHVGGLATVALLEVSLVANAAKVRGLSDAFPLYS